MTVQADSKWHSYSELVFIESASRPQPPES